jgi:putative endonuclease
MYFLYILYSESSDKYYVGYSSDPFRRLIEHNNTLLLTYTSKHRPWELKAVYQCGDKKTLAIKIEQFIKKQKSRKLIQSLVDGRILTGILAQLVRVPHLRD